MSDRDTFTPAELARLDAFLSEHEVDIRRLTEVNEEFNVRRHKLEKCRWWKAGVGNVTPGTWVESPAVVMGRER